MKKNIKKNNKFRNYLILGVILTVLIIGGIISSVILNNTHIKENVIYEEDPTITEEENEINLEEVCLESFDYWTEYYSSGCINRFNGPYYGDPYNSDDFNKEFDTRLENHCFCKTRYVDEEYGSLTAHYFEDCHLEGINNVVLSFNQDCYFPLKENNLI